MKSVVCFTIALVIVLAVGHEGNSIWQVECHDSIKTYIGYERMLNNYEEDICN